MLADHPFQRRRNGRGIGQSGKGPQYGTQRGFFAPREPHQGQQVLEIDIADDRLRIARVLGHGKSGVHVEVGRDQRFIQGGISRRAC